MPSVVLRHDGDLLFLAVGRGDRAVLGDLEITLALDAGLRLAPARIARCIVPSRSY
jgi:hypothetical protein